MEEASILIGENERAGLHSSAAGHRAGDLLHPVENGTDIGLKQAKDKILFKLASVPKHGGHAKVFEKVRDKYGGRTCLTFYSSLRRMQGRAGYGFGERRGERYAKGQGTQPSSGSSFWFVVLVDLARRETHWRNHTRLLAPCERPVTKSL